MLGENIKAAIKYGAHVIGTSVFGLGERMTMADSYRIAEIWHLPVNKKSYNHFCRLHSEYMANYPDSYDLLSPNVIVTGAQLQLRGKCHNAKVKFGVTSDRRVLGKIVGITPDSVCSNRLRRIKDRMYDERVCTLSPRELRNRLRNTREHER